MELTRRLQSSSAHRVGTERMDEEGDWLARSQAGGRAGHLHTQFTRLLSEGVVHIAPWESLSMFGVIVSFMPYAWFNCGRRSSTVIMTTLCPAVAVEASSDNASIVTVFF